MVFPWIGIIGAFTTGRARSMRFVRLPIRPSGFQKPVSPHLAPRKFSYSVCKRRRSYCYQLCNGCTGTACLICPPNGRLRLDTKKQREVLIIATITWVLFAKMELRNLLTLIFLQAWEFVSGFTIRTHGLIPE